MSPAPFLRSLVFNAGYAGWAALSSLLFAPLFLISTEAALRAGTPWARGVLWLARRVCGLSYEIRGGEYLVEGPFIYASKHQSAWETAFFYTQFRRPAYVLKRELLRIPLWGWYLWRMRMISIDRGGGLAAMKEMIRQAKDALAAGRPIVIFPEGTRKAPGAPPSYHPGVAALYGRLNVPVVPVALNSGVYWGKNAFTKRPGTVIVQCLPPIPPGLGREAFMARLQEAIETASQRLLQETKDNA